MTGRHDRASVDDVVTLATDVGRVPLQVGAVLVVDRQLDLDEVRGAVEERIAGVPRMRQRLIPTPLGAGRPVWVDDGSFDIAEHVEVIVCPAPGATDALLTVAERCIATRLPADRPPWSITLVTGFGSSRSALVVAFHHVLADGIGGLAVLADLVDDGPVGASLPFPTPPPTTSDLRRDAMRERIDFFRHVAVALRRLSAAARQLRPRGPRPRRCSLNRPTGPHRRLAVARVDLDGLHRAARSHRATVNDAILTAVGGALHELLRSRGEDVETFVVSIPVSARRRTSADDLGNQVGAVPIEVPGSGQPLERLRAIAETTRTAKESPPAVSMALIGPLFRALARLGVFGWFIDRQRVVHTFVTNLHGPGSAQTFLGATILEIVPVATVTGNVTVSFAALSYAGTLAVTIIADPEACPDLELLRDLLERQLGELAT